MSEVIQVMLDLTAREFFTESLPLWVNSSGMMVDMTLLSADWIFKEPKPRKDGLPSKLPSAVLSTIFYALMEPCFTAGLLWLGVPPWILTISSMSFQGAAGLAAVSALPFALYADRLAVKERQETGGSELHQQVTDSQALNQNPGTNGSTEPEQSTNNGSYWSRLTISNITEDGATYFLLLITSAYANASLLLYSQNIASIYDRNLVAVSLGYFALAAYWGSTLFSSKLLKEAVPLQSSSHIPYFLDQLGLLALQFVIKLPLRYALGLDPLMAFRKVDPVRAQELFGEARYEWILRWKDALPWWWTFFTSGLSVALTAGGAWYMSREQKKRYQELLEAKIDAGGHAVEPSKEPSP